LNVTCIAIGSHLFSAEIAFKNHHGEMSSGLEGRSGIPQRLIAFNDKMTTNDNDDEQLEGAEQVFFKTGWSRQ
jgi:hypothetical protein